MRHRVVVRGWTALAVLAALALAACASSAVSAGAASARDPTTKIHNASASSIPLFARIVFTPATTYDQAITLLARDPYPWTCDDPRTPTPPAPAAQRAGYAATHTLLVSYPGWDMLTRLAQSPHVVAVAGVALYQCP